jgi:hypothetical protein
MPRRGILIDWKFSAWTAFHPSNHVAENRPFSARNLAENKKMGEKSIVPPISGWKIIQENKLRRVAYFRQLFQVIIPSGAN